MRGTRKAGLLVALLMVGTVLAAPPAQAGSGALTPTQRTAIYNQLVADGVAPADATAIANDDSQAVLVPMPGTGTETEEVWGKTKNDGGGIPNAIGDCSGSGAWVQRTQYINNTYGQHIAYIRLKTNFSYNGSRVTCAGSTRSHYVYTWALPAVSWKAWEDFTEYFYTSGGHANGGVLTETTGIFALCVAGKGCVLNRYPWAQTRGYYNGTWLTYGGSP